MSGPLPGNLPPGNSWWRPAGVSGARPSGTAPEAKPPSQAADFAAALDNALAPLRFSGHAQQRLALSGRRLSDTEMDQLRTAVDRLAAKGAKESLVLLPDLAFVVSVRSRTVITALEGTRAREGVFTGIDSAAVL